MPSRSGDGPARAFMPCPRDGGGMGLLDGLATAIRFRLSSRACEGAWPGPDAMGVGVVFAGLIGPVNLLPTLIPIAAARPVGRVRTDAGRCCLHRQSCPAPPVPKRAAGALGKLGTPGAPARNAPMVRGVESGRRRLAVCGHDADPLEERRRRKATISGLRSQPVSGAARFAPCWRCPQAMKRELQQQRDADRCDRRCKRRTTWTNPSD